MKPLIALFLVTAATSLSLRGDVVLPALFSDHAVLQKSSDVPVWGKASPGEVVKVALDRATASTVAGVDGKWRVRLDLSRQGQGPFELVVQGNNRVVARDVIVGEVWFCSGQSNMTFPLGAFPSAKEEVAASANPLLRYFNVKIRPSPTPLDDAEGGWVLADPKTTGQFSAVAYYFGKNLQRALQTPIGLVHASDGGTYIETWMSREALDADPGVKADADRALADREAFDSYITGYKAWQKAHAREDRATADPQAFAAPDIDTSDWKPVTLPGALSAAGLPDSGAIWLRKTIPVPSAPNINPGKGIDLFLGEIRDFADVYWNGRKIGSGDITTITHRYGVRFNLVQPGEGVLAIRVFNPAKGAGIFAPKGVRFQGNHYMLAGEWLAKAETTLPVPDAAALADLPAKPAAAPYETKNVSAHLFNGLVAPMIPYAVRGVIWYQGEGNWNRGHQYRTEFPLLIQDWRAKWGRGDLPFYYCQVANLYAPATKPGNDWQSELREAQSMALALPNTGQAVLIDIGEEADIHPANKADVGARLARIALARDYGRTDIVYSGPVFAGSAIEGARIRVKFTHTGGGLVVRPVPAVYQPSAKDPKTKPLVRNSPDSELEGFAICGEDRKWVWADAKIDGDSVLVSSPEVPSPVAVRYAWSNNPICNLYNEAGLPAGPFRTDDFPPLSLKNRY